MSVAGNKVKIFGAGALTAFLSFGTHAQVNLDAVKNAPKELYLSKNPKIALAHQIIYIISYIFRIKH